MMMSLYKCNIRVRKFINFECNAKNRNFVKTHCADHKQIGVATIFVFDIGKYNVAIHRL